MSRKRHSSRSSLAVASLSLAATAYSLPLYPARIDLTASSPTTIAADAGVFDSLGRSSGCRIAFTASVYDQFNQPFSGLIEFLTTSQLTGFGFSEDGVNRSSATVYASSSGGGTTSVYARMSYTRDGTVYFTDSNQVPCTFSKGSYQSIWLDDGGSGSGTFSDCTFSPWSWASFAVNGCQLLYPSQVVDTKRGKGPVSDAQCQADSQVLREYGEPPATATTAGQAENEVKYQVSWVPAPGSNPAPPGWWAQLQSSAVVTASRTGDGLSTVQADSLIMGGSLLSTSASASYPGPYTNTTTFLSQYLYLDTPPKILSWTLKSQSSAPVNSGSYHVPSEGQSIATNQDAGVLLYHSHYNGQ